MTKRRRAAGLHKNLHFCCPDYRLLSFLLLVALCALLSAVRAGGAEGPLLRGPFSISGEPVKGIPFTFHWHPGSNIASLFLRYPSSHTKNEFAYFSHVWSLDQDRVLVFYKGFNISFCHEYPVVGDVPRRFWHSVENVGQGKCSNGVGVTWYEGKFNPLFVPYGVKSFLLGFDRSDRVVCANIVPYAYGHKTADDDDSASDAAPASPLMPGPGRLQSLMSRLLSHHKGKELRFDVDFNDAPPPMSVLLPRWLQRQCKRRDLGDEGDEPFDADEFVV